MLVLVRCWFAYDYAIRGPAPETAAVSGFAAPRAVEHKNGLKGLVSWRRYGINYPLPMVAVCRSES